MQRKPYQKPMVERVQLDTNISIVMMSPIGDPPGVNPIGGSLFTPSSEIPSLPAMDTFDSFDMPISE